MVIVLFSNSFSLMCCVSFWRAFADIPSYGRWRSQYDNVPEIPWKDVKFSMFGSALQTKNPYEFLDEDDLAGDILKETVSTALGAFPVVGTITQLLFSIILQLTDDDSEWKRKFKEAILNDVDKKLRENEVNHLVARIEAIYRYLAQQIRQTYSRSEDDCSADFT